jgi:hypothetical protein
LDPAALLLTDQHPSFHAGNKAPFGSVSAHLSNGLKVLEMGINAPFSFK